MKSIQEGNGSRAGWPSRRAAVVTAHRRATYKLATLLAIVDVTAERTAPGGREPDVITGRDVARRVIGLYWPQTVPYGTGAAPRVLSQAAQNAIAAKLAADGEPATLIGRPAWKLVRAVDLVILLAHPHDLGLSPVSRTACVDAGLLAT